VRRCSDLRHQSVDCTLDARCRSDHEPSRRAISATTSAQASHVGDSRRKHPRSQSLADCICIAGRGDLACHRTTWRPETMRLGLAIGALRCKRRRPESTWPFELRGGPLRASVARAPMTERLDPDMWLVLDRCGRAVPIAPHHESKQQQLQSGRPKDRTHRKHFVKNAALRTRGQARTCVGDSDRSAPSGIPVIGDQVGFGFAPLLAAEKGSLLQHVVKSSSTRST
jgi:hypothetical protein